MTTSITQFAFSNRTAEDQLADWMHHPDAELRLPASRYQTIISMFREGTSGPKICAFLSHGGLTLGIEELPFASVRIVALRDDEIALKTPVANPYSFGCESQLTIIAGCVNEAFFLAAEILKAKGWQGTVEKTLSEDIVKLRKIRAGKGGIENPPRVSP